MIKKFFNNFIKTFVSFNLIVLPAFGTAPETTDRTLDKINVFLQSSAPSEIPFIDYIEEFLPDNTQPLKKFDLSTFDGKKIFVGYGVYDIGQNYCKYIEKPSTPDHTLYFDDIYSFNKHTYAISKGTMSYDNCVILANTFGGLPAVVTSSSENTFVQSIGGSKNKWIGAERASCSTPYTNKLNNEQLFFNWSTIAEAQCNASKLNITQNENGNWLKTEKNLLNYCVIEVDSEDFKRPIKICAPWWKVERTYLTPKQTMYSGVDIYQINQADIPEQFTVCAHFNPPALLETQAKPDREVTCTSYYDTQVAPECIRNPKQAICFVDECNGYIKNACKKEQDLKSFKDYTKAESILNNTNTVIKGKMDITTHVYKCPPSLPSLKDCNEKATVVIFPQECSNNSDCEGRKNCILSATTTEARNKCSEDFKCEKIYGSPDQPKYDASGDLVSLSNQCKDGEDKTFPINIQNKETKKCLEYEYYNVSEQVTQKCILNRDSSEHTVNTYLNEEDIYMNQPNCIRTNNVLSSRPTVAVKIDYKNMGYAKTIIKKSYLDESQLTPVNAGNDSTIVDAAMHVVDPIPAGNNEIPTVNQNATTNSNDCSAYTQSWYERNDILNQKISYTKTATNGTTSTAIAVASGLYKDSSGLYFPYTDIASLSDCSSIKSKISQATTSIYEVSSKLCKIYVSSTSADIFESIKGNGSLNSFIDSTDGSTFYEYNTYTHITKDPVNKATCDKISYCLNGTYNVSTYNSVGMNQCQVTTGDSVEYLSTDVANELEIGAPTGVDENCKPFSSSGSYLSQFDGTQDVFSVQEVVTGDFGYYSNYNSHPFINNFVSVNDLEVYPIKPMAYIDDPLIYQGEFLQKSISTKSPNIVAGAIGGAGAGVAAASYVALTAVEGATALLAFGPIGWIIFIVIVVFVVVAMLFGKITKLNEEDIYWIIYKDVALERYKENIYGYDHRKKKVDSLNNIVLVNGKIRFIYYELDAYTGRSKPGEFKKMLQKLLKLKENLITCLGWDKTAVQSLHVPMEQDIVVPYPKCKKLSWSCNKTNQDNKSVLVNPFKKKMTNNYVGAVNGVSIVVPYLGEYEVKAYDQFDNLLGSLIIKEDEFIDMTNNMAKYAQLNFGLTMELADGINEGDNEYACRRDLMVEWGGGVSGIYFENNSTGTNTNCQKSHDAYVSTSSATKLTIKATGIDRPHIIELEKPIPFANRIFLVTLNKKEIRTYKCYKDFGECANENFTGVEQ